MTSMLIRGFERLCSLQEYKKYIIANEQQQNVSEFNHCCCKMNPNTIYFYNNDNKENGFFIRNVREIERHENIKSDIGEMFIVNTLLNKKFTILAK